MDTLDFSKIHATHMTLNSHYYEARRTVFIVMMYNGNELPLFRKAL